MLHFDISAPNTDILPQLVEKVDDLTKPKGSLGRLEELAIKIGLIQQTVEPQLNHPCNILFAADHGILDEGVSVSPKEVTWQQLSHFRRGGAGINFLCNQHGFELVLVDAGVDYDIPKGKGIIDKKIRRGTRNFLHEAAITPEEWDECLKRGAEVVEMVHAKGCNIVSFGEMGSGNTSPSSMWMHILTGIPLRECIGAGAGLCNNGVEHKFEVLFHAWNNFQEAWNNCYTENSVEQQLRWFGGYELAMAVGGMLKAAELRMVIIVDGFIMTACMAAAAHFYPHVMDYAVFGHCGDESGHKRMLDALGVRAILNLDLRLGEGSGAVCAYPILVSAVNMINEMDRFSAVGVTKYF